MDKQRRGWEGKADHGRKTDLLNGPFYFVDQHAVHVWDDLDRHVDEALAEDEADVVGGCEASTA